jgi:hypothetical protein
VEALEKLRHVQLALDVVDDDRLHFAFSRVATRPVLENQRYLYLA